MVWSGDAERSHQARHLSKHCQVADNTLGSRLDASAPTCIPSTTSTTSESSGVLAHGVPADRWACGDSQHALGV